jgi:hypothetical protein
VFLDLRKSAKVVKMQSSESVSAVNAVKTALSDREENADTVASKEQSLANLQIRPRLSLLWIAQILDAQDEIPLMFGESTYAAFMGALPRALRPNRYWWDHASFVQRHYRLPMIDVGDNLVATGLSDFGLFGAWLAGFLFGLLLSFFSKFANTNLFQSPVISLVVYCMCFDMVINFEASSVTPFVNLRNFVVLFVAYKLIKDIFPSLSVQRDLVRKSSMNKRVMSHHGAR